MKKTQSMLTGIILFTCFLIAMTTDPANAQIAKIQRQTATLSVEPSLVIQGSRAAVTIEPFVDTGYRLTVISQEDGEWSNTYELGRLESIHTQTITLPEAQEAEYRVILQAQLQPGWQAVAYNRLSVLPNFYQEVQDLISQLETYEQQAETDAPWWEEQAHREARRKKRRAWAALAFADDLLERAKRPTGGTWDIITRLGQLRDKVEQIKQGEAPLAEQRGYQLRGYRSELNGRIQPYSLYVPNDYTGDKAWPLVVMLHGAWSNHHLALRRVFGKTNNRGEDDFRAKRAMPELPEVPYLVVAPNGYETMSYEGFAEQDVFTVMDEVANLYRVDTNRVYLTGLSMGGGGTFKIGLRHPSLFAAMAPVCGYVYTNVSIEAINQSPPILQRLEKSFAPIEIAENARHLPIKMMHGDADPVVPPMHSKTMHEKFQALGYQSELEMYPGVGHEAWVPAYKDARIFDWFAQFERDPRPDRVVFATGDPQGGSAYWVAIDEPAEVRKMARIEAQAEEGRVTVQTENVERLSLQFVHEYFFRRDSIKVMIDGQMVNEGAFHTETRSFRHNGEDWVDDQSGQPNQLLPGFHGSHEPWVQPHVYAYAAQGDDSLDQQLRLLALRKSTPQGHEDVQWPIVPEGALTDEIMSKNHVILWAQVGTSSFLDENWDDKQTQPFADPNHLLGDWTLQPGQALSVTRPNPKNPKKYIQINLAHQQDGIEALRSYASSERSLRDMVRPDLVIYNQDGSIVGMGLFNKEWELEAFDWVQNASD